MNIISYSLYGNRDKFNLGAIANAKQAKDLFPDWQTRFYAEVGTTKEVLQILENNNADVRVMGKSHGHSGMFWRFLPVSEQINDRVLVRDCDSRFSAREMLLVSEWIESTFPLHIIRDHPMHDAPILGGLWGICPSSLPSFSHDLAGYTPKGLYGEDQDFLARYVYRSLASKALIHDAYFNRELNRIRMSVKRFDGEYIGESKQANGDIDQKLREMAVKGDSSKIFRLSIQMKSLCRIMLRK